MYVSYIQLGGLGWYRNRGNIGPWHLWAANAMATNPSESIWLVPGTWQDD